MQARSRHLGWFALVASFVGCNPSHVAEVLPNPDAKEVEFCPAACKRLVSQGCAEERVCSRRLFDGECETYVSCAEWCVEVVEDSPAFAMFRPKCVATVPLPEDPVDMCDWLDVTCAECANPEVPCE